MLRPEDVTLDGAVYGSGTSRVGEPKALTVPIQSARLQAITQQICDLQDYLFRKYGEPADSIALIRADRER